MKRLAGILASLLLLLGTTAGQTLGGASSIGGVASAGTISVTTMSNIQLESSSLWTLEGGVCCGTVTVGTDSSSLGNSSPSLSGGSINLESSGAGYNVQAYYDPGCTTLPGGICTGFSQIHATISTYVPSTSPALQGMEGPNVVIYTGTYELYPSLQCATNANSTTPSTPTWNLYSMQAVSGDTWVPTNISCASYLSSTNTWHQIDVYYLLNFAAVTMSYGALYLDGTLVSNFAGGYSSSGRSYTGATHFRPQVQLDSKTGAGTSNYYVDNYTLTIQ